MWYTVKKSILGLDKDVKESDLLDAALNTVIENKMINPLNFCIINELVSISGCLTTHNT